jgi:hypothetical protein
MLQDLATWLAALRRAGELPAGQPLCLVGQGDAAVACLYHALLTDQAAGLALDTMPDTHRRGAYLPGILRVMDIPHAVGLLAPRPVGLTGVIQRHHGWALRAYARAGATDRLTLAPTFDGVLRGVLGLLGG